jgi:uncharacterized membrane protein YvbJ
MKLCLICGHREQDSAETCSKCGEASWSALEQAPAVELIEKPKRGKK